MRARTLLVVTATAVAALGCGGGADQASSPTSSLPPAYGDAVATTATTAAPSTTAGATTTTTPTAVTTTSPPTTAPAPVPPVSPTTAGGGAKASFLARANAICGEFNAEYRALPGRGSSDPAVIRTTSLAVAGIYERGAARLRTLTPPPGEAAIVDGLISGLERLPVFARDLAAAIERGDRTAANQLARESTSLVHGLNAGFRAYGLTVCGEE